VNPTELAQRLAWLQQWMGRAIAARQASLHPDRPWPAPRAIADGTIVIDPANDKQYPSVNPNHVEHLGTSGLAGRQILAEIIDLYRTAGASRFFFYLSPSGQAADLEAWLGEYGFAKMTELCMLGRPAQSIGRPECDFDICVSRPTQADLLRQVVSDDGDEFGYATATLDMLGHPGFHTMIATLNKIPAACGSLYVHQNLAYLGNGTTLPEYRKRGAQSALIAARLGLASALGCTDAVSETYSFLPSSYANLERAGFVELYSRAIFRWEAPDSRRA